MGQGVGGRVEGDHVGMEEDDRKDHHTLRDVLREGSGFRRSVHRNKPRRPPLLCNKLVEHIVPQWKEVVIRL